MKEKIKKILTIDRGVVYGDFPGLISDLDELFNQEVEKRIAERMPSEEEMDNEVDNRYPNVANPHIFGKQLGFGDCYFWLRSRLLLIQDQKKRQVPSR